MIYPFYGPQSGLPGPDPFGGYDYPQYPFPLPGQQPYGGLPQPFPTPFLPDSYEGEYTEQDSYDDIPQPTLPEPMEEMPILGDGLGMGIPSMMGMGEFGLGDPTGGLGSWGQSSQTQMEMPGASFWQPAAQDSVSPLLGVEKLEHYLTSIHELTKTDGISLVYREEILLHQMNSIFHQNDTDLRPHNQHVALPLTCC